MGEPGNEREMENYLKNKTDNTSKVTIILGITLPVTYKYFRMSSSEFFDKECMMLIIENTDWGKAIADGNQFYKCLFKMDKKESITVKEVNVMFASYKNWKIKIGNMLLGCKNQTREDNEAITWANKTDEDIIQHMHAIISEKKCENTDLVTEFINRSAELKQAMLQPPQPQQADNNQMQTNAITQ